MKLIVAAILVSRGMNVLQAAPAAHPYRSREGIMQKLIFHRIDVSDVTGSAKPRNSTGGFAILPEETPYPLCNCGQRMALFLQFDIRPEFGLPFVANSHLLVFQCPAHDGVPRNQWAGWGRLEHPQLPPQYWLGTDTPDPPHYGSYMLMLHKPAAPVVFHPKDPFVRHKELTFKQIDEEIHDNSEDRKVVPAVARDGLPGVTGLP